MNTEYGVLLSMPRREHGQSATPYGVLSPMVPNANLFSIPPPCSMSDLAVNIRSIVNIYCWSSKLRTIPPWPTTFLTRPLLIETSYPLETDSGLTAKPHLQRTSQGNYCIQSIECRSPKSRTPFWLCKWINLVPTTMLNRRCISLKYKEWMPTDHVLALFGWLIERHIVVDKRTVFQTLGMILYGAIFKLQGDRSFGIVQLRPIERECVYADRADN